MSDLLPTAVVTGGSRGIGRAIAETFATKGMQVFLTYVSRPNDAQEVVATIEKNGGKAKAFCLNVSDSPAVQNFFENEVKDKVALNILVNNAGITKDNFLIRMKDEEFDDVLAANLRGAFLCLREASKIMTKQRHGRIVNISSISGQTGIAAQTNYSASKAGLIGLTMAAAKELAGRNITVNAVAPGFIETEMTQKLPATIRDHYFSQIPLKRFGSVQDVADAVVFLSSEQAGYITGQVLAINGGLYC